VIENPSKPLWACSLTDPALAAEDAEHPERLKRLRAYGSTRSHAALAALELVQGEHLTCWRLRPLTPAQRAECLALTDPAQRYLAAFRIACDARYEGGSMGPDGPTGGKHIDRPKGEAERDEWVVEQVAVGGGWIVDELGGVALVRASVHPKARALFGAR